MKDRNVKAGNVMARVIVARGGWMKRLKEGECGWYFLCMRKYGALKPFQVNSRRGLVKKEINVGDE
jgi:hypothetical protein